VEVLTERTRQANARYFDSPEDVPERCITQGLGTILEARQLLLVVSGADKADILSEALTGPVSPGCPASVLQLHPHVTVVADEAAAARLAAAPAGSVRGAGAVRVRAGAAVA
jgi:glucosamine-6-phosphate deaminase